MAEYPGIENERRFPHAALHHVVLGIFERCGMADADARVLTDQLVEADLRGIHSHGVMRVPAYVGKLTQGGVDPEGRPRVTRDAGAALVIDGGSAMGQIAGAFAMQKGDRARPRDQCRGGRGRQQQSRRRHGVLRAHGDRRGHDRHRHHQRAADHGALGRDRQAGRAEPDRDRHPGGRRAAAGPRCAFGATAHGRMQAYKQKGIPIPKGWAFDQEGRPTTAIDKALEGLVQPIGMYKGIGLAMAAGILSTLLSGAGYGTESGNMVDGPSPGRDGQFYLALNIAAFEDVATFEARMDRIIREYRGTRLAPGFKRVFVPGEMEAELERAQLEQGVPLNAATVQGIRDAAAALGVDASTLR